MEKKKKTIELSVNSSRREFVSKAVKASAFAVPMALGLETITARKVYAQQASQSGGTGGGQQSGGDPGGGGAQQSGAASVSEPAAVTLLGLGLASLALQARRKQKERSSGDS